MTLGQLDEVLAGDLDYVAGAFVDTTSEHATFTNIVLGGFFCAVRDARDTEALVSVWIEHRAEVQKLDERLRVESWAALCRRAEQLGQQHPRVWVKRAVIDEVARRKTEAWKTTEQELRRRGL